MAHDFFPIMPWNWMPDDPVVFRRLREFGATVAGFVPPEHLELAHDAGLQAIVYHPRLAEIDWTSDPEQIRTTTRDVVEAIGTHPAIFGYYLKDEPGADLFPGLAAAAEEIRLRAQGTWPYINLLPDYATSEQLGSATYDEHLESFITTCAPPIVSYDNYSLLENDVLRPNYWTNLESMRAATRRHHLPFWNIVLTVAHFTYREISAADARFQAFTTLAYGGRGLSYFTYFAPMVGNYRMAPVDQFGHETPAWDILRHINLQIAQWAPTLLQLSSDDTYHLGPLPDGTHGPGEDSLLTAIHGMDRALVGEFTHRDGTRYLMIVNTDFHNSAWCHPEFRLTPECVDIISPYTGQPIPYTGEQRVLAPGQAHLLRLG